MHVERTLRDRALCCTGGGWSLNSLDWLRLTCVGSCCHAFNGIVAVARVTAFCRAERDRGWRNGRQAGTEGACGARRRRHVTGTRGFFIFFYSTGCWRKLRPVTGHWWGCARSPRRTMALLGYTAKALVPMRFWLTCVRVAYMSLSVSMDRQTDRWMDGWMDGWIDR